jgi:cell division protein FtsI/penicillin-binding protein 2
MARNFLRSPERSRRERRGQKSFGFTLPHDRLGWLRLTVFFLAGIVAVRLFSIQVLHHGFYAALAEGQYERSEELTPSRGELFLSSARDGRPAPLAVNRELYLLYAVPRDIEGIEDTITKLLPYVSLDEDTMRERLSKEGDLYEPIEHKVPPDRKDAIDALDLPGIRFQPEEERFYPEKNVGSHVTGFVGFVDDARTGQYGLEGYFHDDLAGVPGYLQAQQDAGGRLIPTGNTLFEPAVDGTDLYLTIDQAVEYVACTKLDEAVQRHGAEGGSVLIMEPSTGAILALCGAPDYDPNAYNEVEDIDVYRNPAVENTYEPGSVFKPFTMAAALDLGKVTPETTFEDTGSVEIGRYTIRNSNDQVYGVQTMTQVLEESINTGAIFAARQAGNQKFFDYVKAFGFGERTDIQLPGEPFGDISSLESEQDLYTATASFGQGITVTPLQLLQGYGAIANNGVMMKPYLVKEKVTPSGAHIVTSPKEVRQVISEKTAATLTGMLANVVINGHGKRAGVPGYYIAGKTGTAQVPLGSARGYDPHRTIGTFAGFGPVTDPAFVMVVKIDEPKDVQFAESTAAPLFGEIAQFLLQYYDIPPSRIE